MVRAAGARTLRLILVDELTDDWDCFASLCGSALIQYALRLVNYVFSHPR
jgi:hypothetical protein